MAWNFRRRVKLIPGVHLNFSQKGISTSIGTKGASLTFKQDGIYLNTSIPGIGLYQRKKIFENKNEENNDTNLIVDNILPFNSNDLEQFDFAEISSQDKYGIIEAIHLARKEREELKNDIKKLKRIIIISKFKLTLSYILMFEIINKRFLIELKEDVDNQKNTLERLTVLLENCYVNVDIDFDNEVSEKYEDAVRSYQRLSQTKFIWNVTNLQWENSYQSRAAYNFVYDRKKVLIIDNKSIEIKSKYKAFIFNSSEDRNYYIYPSFLLLFYQKDKIKIIDYKDFEIEYVPTNFVEEEFKPDDSLLLNYTWKRVNKNGSPDRRFSNNYQIPIFEYGIIKILIQGTIIDQFIFSNNKAAMEFYDKFSLFKKKIDELSPK